MSFLNTDIDIDTNLQNRSLIKEDVFIEQLSLKFENIDPAMIVSLVKSLRDVLSTELIAKKKTACSSWKPRNVSTYAVCFRCITKRSRQDRLS